MTIHSNSWILRGVGVFGTGNEPPFYLPPCRLFYRNRHLELLDPVIAGIDYIHVADGVRCESAGEDELPVRGGLITP